jgi:hypothetical protein
MILTVSSSQDKKAVTIPAYRTRGCRTSRARYRSSSMRRASTKSLENRPAYCFSGSGGRARPGRDRKRAVCNATKWENLRDTVTRTSVSGPWWTVTVDPDRECPPRGLSSSVSASGSGWKSEVTLYTMYAGANPELTLVGECTSTLNGGTLAFHAGPTST